MRLTIVGPAYPLRGGIAHHVHWLGGELAGRGHQLQIVSFRRLYPKLLFPGATPLDRSRRKLEIDALRILDSLNPLTWIRSCEVIRAFSPSLVLVEWWTPLLAPLVAVVGARLRRAGIRCVAECHNVLPHERFPLDSVLFRFALRAIDRVVAHSSVDREHLRNIARAKQVRVVSLPRPASFVSGARGRRDGRTILFFGLVRRYKGLDVLLRAMPKVLSVLDCRLIVAGEFYDGVESYRKLVRELDLESRVTIEDRYVPNEEVADLFAQADVLVLPYRTATQSAVAQIAFANALPVIASDCGGLAEVVIENQNGLLFPAGDADRLAEAILTYFAKGLGPMLAGNLLAAGAESQSAALAEAIEQMAS